jgi:ABC-type antimicrobial peptide transport system permease subunit
MLRNYFKIAFRNLWRSKGYAFLNIAGLAVGLACSFLIMLWAWDELGFDAFHQNSDRLYVVEHNWLYEGNIGTGTPTPFSLAGGLKSEFPEIEHACRVDWERYPLMMAGEKKVYLNSRFVDAPFLEMFSFRLQQGSPKTALQDPNSVVLTEKAAKILFGDADPMGRLVRFDDKSSRVDVRVTGVVADLPGNSSLQFDCLLPYSLNISMNPWLKDQESNWGNSMTQTFVQLHPHATAAGVNPKLLRFLATKNPELKEEGLFLHPMAKLRLYDKFENGQAVGGLIDYVRMFSWIAAFILLIACINFTNLATARSEKRAKEVGIRKVVGSSRQSLVFQFLGESNLLALLALVLAAALVSLLLPWFNVLTGKALAIPLGNVTYWLVGLGIAVFAGLLAGLYPAFYLSSFRPVRVLKSTLQVGKKASLPRKILVNLQFTFSIILIIGVIVINKQLQHSRNRPVGYDRNNLLMLDMTAELRKNYEVFRQDLLDAGVATAVTYTSSAMTQISNNIDDMGWTGKRPSQKVVVVPIAADYDFVPTFAVKITRGRGFSRSLSTDSSAVLLNEAAVKAMGLTDPLNQQIKFSGKQWNIVGVMQDVVMDSPYEKPGPVAVFNGHDWKFKVNIRLKTSMNVQTALARTGRIFIRHSPSYPFDYQFVDDEYNKKFAAEVRIGHLANAFAGLAIFISCLGLFGLAAYTAERRTKEIGIRKILGASLTDVVGLLSREYLGLVALSLLIASPLAWYFLDNWLRNYEYRTTIDWWIFALAGLFTVAVALLTVSFQSIRAALANPAKSLRSE